MLKFLKWVGMLMSLALLAACGGGGGGDAVTNCSFTGATSSFSVPAQAGETVSFNAFSFNAVSGCAISYTASNLPTGLSINNSSGLISGKVLLPGAYTIFATATARSTDGGTGDTRSRNITLNVSSAAVAWSTLSSATGLPASMIVDRVNLMSIGTNFYALFSVNSAGKYLPQLWKSTNGGVAWVNTNLNPPNPTGTLDSYGVTTDGTNIYLISGYSNTATTATFSNNVYSIAPEAASPAWTTQTTAAFSGGGRALSAVTYNGGALYVHGGIVAGNLVDYALYKSTNGGATWTSVASSTTPYAYNHCMQANGSSYLIIGGYGSPASPISLSNSTRVFKSTDSGSNWIATSTTVPSNPLGVACASNGNTVYISGGSDGNNVTNAMYKSTDFGSTWQTLLSNTVFEPRRHHGMIINGGSLLILSGYNGSNFVSSLITTTLP